MKVDIETMKEQMTMMMEAMISIRKMMEVNAEQLLRPILLLRGTQLTRPVSIKRVV